MGKGTFTQMRKRGPIQIAVVSNAPTANGMRWPAIGRQPWLLAQAEVHLLDYGSLK